MITYRLKNNNLSTSCIKQGVHTDTLIWTSEGYKRAKHIKLGDLVQTKLGFKPVQVISNHGVIPCIKVITNKGFEITCTDDLALDTPSSIKKEVNFPNSYIKSGDSVNLWYKGVEKYPNNYLPLDTSKKIDKSIKDVELPSLLTEDVALALAFILSRGTFNRATINLYLTNSKLDYVQSLFKSIFKIEITGSPYNNNVTYIYSTLILNWCENNNIRKSEDIPDVILRSPISVQCAFIRGLFSSRNKIDDNVNIMSIHKKWLQYIQNFCLLHFGMSSVIKKIANYSRTIKKYKLVIKDKESFLKNIGYIWNDDLLKLKTNLKPVKSNKVMIKISSIEKIEAPIVNFMVDDTFCVANGFIFR